MPKEHKKKKKKTVWHKPDIKPSKKFSKEPWEHKCFSRDFSNLIQLFNILTGDLDFSYPFRVVIDYDPERARTSVKTYLPKSLHESRIREEQEKWKGQ